MSTREDKSARYVVVNVIVGL